MDRIGEIVDVQREDLLRWVDIASAAEFLRFSLGSSPLAISIRYWDIARKSAFAELILDDRA